MGLLHSFCTMPVYMPSKWHNHTMLDTMFRQQWPVFRTLSTETMNTLVQAFIPSHLDYYNSLLHGLPDTLLRKLQPVQTATRLITGMQRHNHIKAVLHQLHGLPVQHCIEFKVVCLVLPVTWLPGQRLQARVWVRLTNSVVNHCRDKYGATDTKQLWWDKSFVFTGPCLWNNLPPSLWHESSYTYEQFKWQSKSLFRHWARRSVTVWYVALQKSAYLLAYN